MTELSLITLVNWRILQHVTFSDINENIIIFHNIFESDCIPTYFLVTDRVQIKTSDSQNGRQNLRPRMRILGIEIADNSDSLTNGNSQFMSLSVIGLEM